MNRLRAWYVELLLWRQRRRIRTWRCRCGTRLLEDAPNCQRHPNVRLAAMTGGFTQEQCQ